MDLKNSYHLEECYKIVLSHVEESASRYGRQSEDILLVSVSKTRSCSDIEQVYKAGCRNFGENRVQEALEKIKDLPKDIRWHLIGTLQKNKVHKAVGNFSLIHSVDSLELAQKISEASEIQNIKTNILLQVNTSLEPSKHGLTMEEWRKHILEIDQLQGIQLEGLMTMAPYIEDKAVIRNCFAKLRHFKEELQQKIRNPSIFKHLSMGMSEDYNIAIEEGATIVRLGSAIFDKKNCLILP